jgi:hypothetical protein
MVGGLDDFLELLQRTKDRGDEQDRHHSVALGVVAPARAGVTGAAGVFVPAQGTVLERGRWGVWYPVQVAGLAGVPTSGVSSVQVSVTALNPDVTGYLKLAANGTATVSTSSLISLVVGRSRRVRLWRWLRMARSGLGAEAGAGVDQRAGLLHRR